MLSLPDTVFNFLYTFTLENRSPAYLLVMKDGRLSSWGGNLTLYGLTDLQQGEYVEQQILFLIGLLPLNGLSVNLPCVEMESGISADVYIFSTNEGDWVILLDATLFENQRSLVQQKGNDLSLLRHKQARILNQQFSHYTSKEPDFLHFVERGERRDVTILVAKICGFNTYIDNNSPLEVVGILNYYISTMMQSLLDEGGMIDKIMGNGVMTVFGIIPVSQSPTYHALKAALRTIETVREIDKVELEDNYLRFDTGISITSGSVVLGVFSSHNQKKIITAGCKVDLAEQLGYQVRPREILIDENTFNQLGEMQKYFSVINLLERGIIEPRRIYSYQVK